MWKLKQGGGAVGGAVGGAIGLKWEAEEGQFFSAEWEDV